MTLRTRSGRSRILAMASTPPIRSEYQMAIVATTWVPAEPQSTAAPRPQELTSAAWSIAVTSARHPRRDSEVIHVRADEASKKEESCRAGREKDLTDLPGPSTANLKQKCRRPVEKEGGNARRHFKCGGSKAPRNQGSRVNRVASPNVSQPGEVLSVVAGTNDSESPMKSHPPM